MTTPPPDTDSIFQRAVRRYQPLIVTSGLQGANLLSKALFVFVVARHLPVADVGIFGLLVATLGMASLAVGLDFTSFSTREILKRDRSEVAPLLRDQLVLNLLTYGLLGPPFVLLFLAGMLPWELLPWFFVLLILDHLTAELQRLLVLFHWNRRAALVLFMRQGSSVWFLLVSLALDPDLASLHRVFAAWTAGEAAALLLALFWLRDLGFGQTWKRPIDWAWLRRGLGVALPLLAATLAFAGIGLIERYVLQSFWGLDLTGVYTFYLYVPNAIQSLVGIGVSLAFQTRILLAWQKGAQAEYRRLMREFTLLAVGMVLLTDLAAAALIWPVVTLIGRPIYGEHLTAFGVALALPLFAVLVNILQLALYARHWDRHIVASSVMGLAAIVLFSFLLIPWLDVLGAALAHLGALCVVAFCCLIFLRHKTDDASLEVRR